MTRRDFLRSSAAASAAVAAAVAADGIPARLFAGERGIEARYWERLPRGEIRCLLCPRRCVVPPGKRGYCRVRENREGVYRSLVHGEPCALHIDPIEKKPFFHVLPGTQALSLATVGCNLACKFCQNWQISQSSPEDAETRHTPPSAIVDEAKNLRAPSIAYTYGEPIVFIEYMQDIASLGRAQGLRSVVVSNGFIEKAPLLDICGMVDAIKIDLKAFEDSYYRTVCDASLRPVLETIETIRSRGVWLEIVCLVVPTLNDGEGNIRDMARWIAGHAGPDVPVHFSRFFPQYRLANLPPTPVSTLEAAHDICRAEGLRFVYIGNAPGHRAESTWCPSCGRRIIAREGYRVTAIEMTKGRCRFCGADIPGIWKET